VKIFLSYSNEDKDLAGKIKKGMEDYGLDVFLAHEDVKPSSEWMEAIHEELNLCNVFIPILTDCFNESLWTDQETGFAVARSVYIIPLKINVDPHGFIGKIHALSFDVNNIEDSNMKIISLIASNCNVGVLFRDALVNKFGKSENYKEAENNTKRLIKFVPYNEQQIRNVIDRTMNNYQILDCFFAKKNLPNFVRKYGENIESDIINDFEKKLKDSNAYNLEKFKKKMEEGTI
jgi:hypothetical protein